MEKGLSRNIFEWLVIFLGFSLILLGLGQHFGWLEKKETKISLIRAEDKEEENQGPIFIDISGAVVKPGFYQLDYNSRLNDLLLVCGGLSSWANQSFIQKELNRARFLHDGEKIYIPYFSENRSEDKETIIANSKENGGVAIVNINRANEDELISLPGIGSTYARRIVAYREENGLFSSIEEIKNVAGIGDKTFSAIEKYLVIEQ